MSNPLVSIIVPAIPERENLLRNRCLPSIERQTYSPLEVVVVYDCYKGPYMHGAGNFWIREFGLGRNWRQFSRGASYGAMPRLAGTLLAAGEYIGYLDDDDEFLPDHVEKLMKAIQSNPGTLWATSQFKRDFSDGRGSDIIGSGRIEYGHIGTPIVLHHAECLRYANWKMDGYAEDFALFDAWEKAGLKRVHIPEITVLVHKTV